MSMAQVTPPMGGGGVTPTVETYRGNGNSSITIPIPQSANLVVIIGNGGQATLIRGCTSAVVMGRASGNNPRVGIMRANVSWSETSVTISGGSGVDVSSDGYIDSNSTLVFDPLNQVGLLYYYFIL